MKRLIFTLFKYSLQKIILSFGLTFIACYCFAQSDVEELAHMQAQLNQEIREQPFLAEKPEEVDAYIKSMLDRNVKPGEYSGSNWRRGYTCRDLLRYNWTEYRDCRYYYRYHGRYYY
jgi:hypothetical protein